MSKRLKTNSRADIYQRVTDAIMRDLEQGTRSWIKPWTTPSSQGSAIRPLRHDGTPYRGVNVLILWSESAERGYTSATCMTYCRAQALGGQVRKGESGTTIVYARTSERTADNPATGEEAIERIPVLRGLHGFQCRSDRWSGHFLVRSLAGGHRALSTRIDRADNFTGANGATIVHKSNGACYIPSPRYDRMPPYRQFFDTPTATAAEGYCATLLHELVHWTSAPQRCNRNIGKRFDDHAYAREELVAEIGAAFFVPTSRSRWSRVQITRPILRAGSPCSRQTISRWPLWLRRR